MNRRGRPRKAAFVLAPESLKNITLFLDMVMTMLYATPAMLPGSIEDQMHSRLRLEEAKMRLIDAELGKLSKAYMEYLDLQKEAEERINKMASLIGLVGPMDFNPPIGQDSNHEIALQYLKASPTELRERLPLWIAMRDYLTFAKEARISEMEEFFQRMNYAEGNRQAMESALKRHPKVFKTRKQQGQKYISLK